MKKEITFLIVLFIFIAPLKANLDSLLLNIEKINGLSQVEAPMNYITNDLFVMINGGAETYLEYGFQQALDAKYVLNSSINIGVQIYEMNDDGAAFGIFSSSRNEGDMQIEIGDYATCNDYYLMILKSKYYIVVSTDDNSAKIQNTLKDIALAITSNIKKQGSLPEIVEKGISAGYDIKNIKYIRGKIALSGNYFFTHKEIFKTREAISIDAGDNKLFVFEYNDNLVAIENLSFIKNELLSSGRYTKFEEDSTKLKCIDKNLNYLKFQVLKQYIILSICKNLEDEQIMKFL